MPDFRFLDWPGSAITSETRLLDADNPRGEFRVVLPRKTDVEYDISHRGDHLFLLLRDPERPNSELLVAPVSDPTNTTVCAAHCGCGAHLACWQACA